MKITIDTKQDSQDEIRKVARLLHELMDIRAMRGSGSASSNSYRDDYQQNYQDNAQASQASLNSQASQSPVMEPGFFNMFDSVPSQSSQSPQPIKEDVEHSEEERKNSRETEFEIYEY